MFPLYRFNTGTITSSATSVMKPKFLFRELSNILDVVFPKTFKIRVAIVYS